MAVGTTNMAEPGGNQRTGKQKHEKAMKNSMYSIAAATTNDEPSDNESEEEYDSEDTETNVDISVFDFSGPSKNMNHSQDRNRPRNGNRRRGTNLTQPTSRRQKRKDREEAKEQWVATLSPSELASYQAEERQRRLEGMRRAITKVIRKRSQAKGLGITALSSDDQLQVLKTVASTMGLDSDRL
ncbi:hypothetical protein HII31_08822 [Pseudocercospora fuligena]|uniref:Uncharacterized protein n=1 Tax=Pseudocercospora fuligena TaxID=685502 RepID=A0A8H6VFP5_9PEZI|nr:hypothetical protein HII31_08822 [Pseudocercospora fuligena]